MSERASRRWAEWLRWVALGGAVIVLAVFLSVQRQSIEVSYGLSPSSADAIKEGASGELSDETVPSVEEMTAMVAAQAVVRLPGYVAHWDERRVRAAAGDSAVRIIVAPPGLDEAERERVRAVKNATIRVIGTQVTGGAYQAVADSLDDWRAQFAIGDVTNLLVSLIAGLRDAPSPADVDALRRREPDDTAIRAVADDLRRTGRHVGDGATLTGIPSAAASAFPDGDALYVALPQQPFDAPLPRYGPALARLFPDTPIIVLYGSWIEYDGPHADEFAGVVAASFYGQLADRLSRYAYPQSNVLSAYLNRVTDVRYAGLFDRPLPYRPFDPLRVALPALPWLFAACVLAFLALSVRSLLRPPPAPGRRRRPGALRTIGTPGRLAGLTALAVEMSALTDRASDPALTRGITKLRAARAALDEDLPDRHVGTLLDDARAELDDAARLLPFSGYRPDDYLRGRLS